MAKKQKKSEEQVAPAAKQEQPRKTDVVIEVERPRIKNKDEYIKVLENESEAFKEVAERFTSKYLNARQEIKRLKEELEAERKSKDVILEKNVMLKDTIRTAYIQIGYIRQLLPWFKKWKYRDELLKMDMDLDRMYFAAEGLDRE